MRGTMASVGCTSRASRSAVTVGWSGRGCRRLSAPCFRSSRPCRFSCNRRLRTAAEKETQTQSSQAVASPEAEKDAQPQSPQAAAATASPAEKDAQPQNPAAASAAAQEDTQSQNSQAGAASTEELIADTEFSLSKVSFGKILSPVGIALLTYGFGAYFALLPGAGISSVMLIYGFPLTIFGLALAYAQLDPVPCKTTKSAFELRDTQMTDIQKQVRDDVTRYRYGDEQHLQEALARIFKFGRQGGISRRNAPKLKGIREETVDGYYTLVLEFLSRLEKEAWDDKLQKIETFFGPGIKARLNMQKYGADVFLISDGSGAGRGGGERKGVLPPLMPGLKARQQ